MDTASWAATVPNWAPIAATAAMATISSLAMLICIVLVWAGKIK